MKRQKRSRPFARLTWHRRPTQPSKTINLQPHTQVYGKDCGNQSNERNRLILGDNFSVMTALLEEWENRIDLIYADPPFLSGKAYVARIGRGEDSRQPSEWQTVDSYQDEWPDGGAYLDMLYPRLQVMYRLLAETGSLYLHLDWHASAYARVILDEIFGPDKLLNEIVWVYHGPSPIRSAFKRKHDTILVYTKSKQHTFNADAVRVPYAETTIKTFSSSDKAGFGKIPDLERGKVPEDWWYFPVVARLHKERTGYPTQKPEALLERIILASSNPGDVIADFFCGSGTTVVVAARHGRNWLACDHQPLAIHNSYRRLLLEEARPPFSVWSVERNSREFTLKPDISIHQSDTQVTVTLRSLTSQDTSHSTFPENVDLWEVDWEHDEKIFHSCSQAVRRWRDERLDLQISHIYTTPGSRTLCIRAFDSLGRAGTLKKQIKV